MGFGDGLVKKAGCKVCDFLATLTPDERATAEGFIDDDSYGHVAIATEMAANGWTTSETTVRRHRIGHPGTT